MKNASNPLTLFLTGATGFLGHYLLAELLARPGVVCRVLLRPPEERSRARLMSLLDDLNVCATCALQTGRLQPLFGHLPEALPADALADVDQVVHAAASTKFRSTPDGEPHRTNVEGTRALLDAADAAGVRRFTLVSTAYVGGRTHGLVPQRLLETCCDNANDYERSKWQAERDVWRWTNANRIVTICRPSILIGDRTTGRTTSFGGVYLLARAISLMARAVLEDGHTDRRAVPLRIMGDPDACLNLVPVCVAARKIAAAVLNPADVSGIINVVNPHPPTSREIKRWLERLFAISGGRFTASVWPWPDPSRFEEAFYAAGDVIRDYFRRNIEFEHGPTDAERPFVRWVDQEQFAKCIRYAQSKNWRLERHAEFGPAVEGVMCEPDWYFTDFVARRAPHSTIAQVHTLTAAVRFIVTGKGGGEWTCRYDRGRLAEIRRGPNGLREDFGFRVRREAFDRIIEGARTVQSAYFNGDVDIVGDTLMAMKMVPIIETFLRESPLPANPAR